MVCSNAGENRTTARPPASDAALALLSFIPPSHFNRHLGRVMKMYFISLTVILFFKNSFFKKQNYSKLFLFVFYTFMQNGQKNNNNKRNECTDA